MKIGKYQVKITQQKDGSFLAVCPVLQGCWAEAETYELAVKYIKKHIEICLELEVENARNKDQKPSFWKKLTEKTSDTFKIEMPIAMPAA